MMRNMFFLLQYKTTPAKSNAFKSTCREEESGVNEMMWMEKEGIVIPKRYWHLPLHPLAHQPTPTQTSRPTY
jgi:hypothetical protein